MKLPVPWPVMRFLGGLSLGLLPFVSGSCTGTIESGPGPLEGTAGRGGGSSTDSGAGSGGSTPTMGGNANPPDEPNESDLTPFVTSNGWPSFDKAKAFQLRRLTKTQYIASVKTLLGISTDGMPPVEEVSPAAGFSAIGASTATVSSSGVGQFEDAARFLARAVFASESGRKKVVPCTPSSIEDTGCFRSFVTSFGAKAFRRPLTADEVTRYTDLTSAIAESTGDALQGLEATLCAFLQSPKFLYLVEIGSADPSVANRYRYDGYEMASRLAYFLTNDTPDPALTSAAASGELLTEEGLEREVVRLLSLPGARDAVQEFFASLLSLDSLDALTRPVQIFPKFTPTLGPAMKRETRLVIEELVFERDGDYRSLFDQRDTFVNPELAALYGVPAPSGDAFARVTLPASAQRAGLLGHAGVLAAHEHTERTSPTKRGLFVMTRLLCQNVPLAPPANQLIPPLPAGNLTARQRLDEHGRNPACAACHRTVDPVGLSLEHFDAMGQYRETDNGLAIDDTGQLGTEAYQGLIGLGAVLRRHPALGPCLIQSLYAAAVGHLTTEFDRSTFAALVERFDAQGGRIQDLLRAIASSDGFRYLPPPDGN